MSKASLTKIAVKATKSGKTTFSVQKQVNAFGEDCGYGVWKLCINYRQGRDVKSWCYVQLNMTLEAATALLEKKTK